MILGTVVALSFAAGAWATKQDVRTTNLEIGDLQLARDRQIEATKNQDFREKVVDALADIKATLRDKQK